MVIFLGRWEIELGTDRPNVQALLGEQIHWEALPKRFCAVVEDVLTLLFWGHQQFVPISQLSMYFLWMIMVLPSKWVGNNHCIHSLEKTVEI